ncbi:MAG: FAD-dependent oxidoreductase [Verrucomicrobiota bacterium]
MDNVIIVGQGIIGLCSAYYAARRGLAVTVIDRQPLPQNGCSYGNAGMIVPSHFVPLAAPGMVALGLKWMWNPESPFYIRPRLDADLIGWALKFWKAATPSHVRRSSPLLRDLHLASRAGYEELAALPETDFGLVKKGLLMLCRTARTLEEEGHTAEQARALGVPAEVLDAAATAALEPGITMKVAGSVYFPKDCHLSPDRLMRSLVKACQDLGVKFLPDTEITGWLRDGQRLRALRTSRGEEIAGGQFVLAGGSWSAETIRPLGLRLPMQAGKGYSLTLPNPRQSPEICAILTEARVAVTPMNGGLRIGGTMEIAGLNTAISPRRVRGIINAVPDYYPDFSPADFEGIQPWCGLRPCSPDGLPYLGKTAAAENLIVATGHSMMGVSLAPVTGDIVSRLLTGEAPTHDLTLLSPDRY